MSDTEQQQAVPPESLDALLKALELHRVGRLDDAEAIYQALLKKQAMPEVLCLMGEIALARKQIGLAIEWTERAVHVAPMVGQYRLQLGRLHRSNGNIDESVASYREALTLEPENAAAHNDLANVLFDQGNLDEAIVEYGKAIAINEQFAMAWNNLGNAVKKKGQVEEAINCYRKALSIDPSSAITHFNLGFVLQELRRFDEAVASYRAAISCKPDYLEAISNLGVVLKDQRKFDEAMTCYQSALAINPAWLNALYNTGVLYELQKQFALAEQWYRKTLAAAPGFIAAHVNLAGILHNEGRMEEARWHRDQAYRKQCMFLVPSLTATRSVLLLQDATNGNVPTQFLFPIADNKLIPAVNRIEWVIEYAFPDQQLQLPDYDLVFNTIGDADVIGRASEQMAQFLAQCTKPVLNLPQAVVRTARHLMPQLFAGLDVVIPRVWRVEQADEWFANTEFDFPLLVRPLVSHGGKGLLLVQDREQLAQVKIERSREIYVTTFHDFRSEDGYFRKYRIIFIDRQPFPYHLAISSHWLVHYDTADMTASWKLDEEKRFLADPESVFGAQTMQVIREIGKRLDLDYCGIDFSILPDGRLLIFEANATMLAHPEEEDDLRLRHKNPYIRDIYRAFGELLDRVCAASSH
jgi:tetratricopeptide (TPR) repeat protein/glutathione synthase/RimK-type ligase-like ATP-grasp enzyme